MDTVDWIVAWGPWGLAGFSAWGVLRLMWRLRRLERLGAARYAAAQSEVAGLQRQLAAHAGCWACQDDQTHHAPGDC